MSDKKRLMLAVLGAAFTVAAAGTAFAQVHTDSLWLGDKTGGAGPSHAAEPPAIITIDGFKYGLPQSAMQNLDAVKALIAAADAMGMVRNNDYENPAYNTIGGSTHGWEYRANGMMNGQQVNYIAGFDYRVPAVRAETTPGTSTVSAVDAQRPKGGTFQVAAGTHAWDESTIGVYSAAAKTAATDRLLQIYMLPPAVVFAGMAAVDKIKVATVGGMRQVTVPLPQYSTDLKATMNAMDQIVHMEATIGGKLYTADFSDYKNDRMDYHVFFPHKIVEKVDGATVADLTVYEHWTGPYQVWPLPKEVASN